MAAERRQRVSVIVRAALARPKHERAALVDTLCDGDEDVRREVEALLEASGAGFHERQRVDTNVGRRASWIGREIGPYIVTGAVGAGGMGEVYRAHDSKLGRDVAVKVLPQAFAEDPERRARFDREARLLAALSHPHIGAIYG